MNKYIKAAQALIDAGETDAGKIAWKAGIARDYVETLLRKRTSGQNAPKRDGESK